MPSDISKKRRLPFFIYSEQWPVNGIAPFGSLQLASYRDGSIAVKNVTKIIRSPRMHPS